MSHEENEVIAGKECVHRLALRVDLLHLSQASQEKDLALSAIGRIVSACNIRHG